MEDAGRVSTGVFGPYARYYDLLYRDKDYDAEADFVSALLERHRPGARTLLELGCGSGRHAVCLARRGYRVHGVDRSADMLEQARRRCHDLAPDVAARLEFAGGDIRSLRLGRTFDAVIALFHVMSYQPTNDDVTAALTTAREHLAPGGIFMFDCWYGPAVLTDRPTVRVKRIEGDGLEVTRIAEPTLHPNACLVDVHYTVFIRDRASGAVEELRETHRMRYLFAPEVESLAQAAGLGVQHACEWMSGQPPDASTWGVCFVLRA
jgi:SAM-dependent methyltransferase